MYKAIPSRIDWSLLISFLRRTHKFGDGGLPESSGIAAATISYSHTHNIVHESENAITLWNMAVDRLTQEQIARCDLSKESKVA